MTDLLGRQRVDIALQLHPLAKLPELATVELGPELRLAHEQDLEQLVRSRLEVRQQPDLLERRHPEVLGLVEDQHGALARAPTVDEDAPEGEETLGRCRLRRRDAQLLQGVLEQAVE